MERLAIMVFWLALVSSISSTLIYARNFAARTEKRAFSTLATSIAAVAFGLFLLSLLMHVEVVGFSQAASPFTARATFALVIIGAYLLVEGLYAGRAPKVRVLGLFVMPVAAVLGYLAWHAYRLPYGLTQELSSYWVGMHVSFAVLAYASMTVAVAMAVTYMLQERELRSKKPSSFLKKLPSLETSDVLCYRTVAFSFVFLTLVIATGIIRAEMLPQWSLWYSDVKIIAAVATWLVFGAYLFVRNVFGWWGKRADLFVIVGFAAAVFTYFASWVFASVHQYGIGF